MTIINSYASESWDIVYSAFTQINFTSYDYDVVKEALLQYLQIYHAEVFNDFIESGELIALLELFAYVSELLAYRIDTNSHENFISTAQRKQSILRLAKLISYSASRNIPARGLVKISSVRTSDTVYDSLGNNLANVSINWNDANNSNWQEQFFLVMNLSLTTQFGQPLKSFQVADVLMQQYTFNNALNAFNNGVYPFTASITTAQVAIEVVACDIDANGPFERAPDLNAQFNIIYSSDGLGYGSDYTGFLMFVKQGSLILTNYTIQQPTANRRIQLDVININDTDVWLYQVDNANTITQNWVQVSSLLDQSLAYYNNESTKNLYQVETLENDQIALNFGDGTFSNPPVGQFQLWTRASVNQNITIPASQIQGQTMSFTYSNSQKVSQQFDLAFSLLAPLQNNAASETTEHIRQAAPSTYYSQNRMVNGQDYNTFPLKDTTILKLNTINRTFAGQPKYIEWNDASGAYQNIKLFGDDLTMTFTTGVDLAVTSNSSRTIIDTNIEPLLQTSALLNALNHVVASTSGAGGIITYPRRTFIEDNRPIYRDINGNFVNPYGVQLDGQPIEIGDGSLNEKTVIQGALDQHWYGEPLSYATINGILCGVVNDPVLDPSSNNSLWVSNLPRTIDGVNLYPPGDIGSGLQPVQQQTYFGLRFNPLLAGLGNGTIALYNPNNPTMPQTWNLGVPTPCPANGLSAFTYKPETITLEMMADATTFTVISNIRGSLPHYSLALGGRWSSQITLTSAETPIDFIITPGATAFAEGDAFVINLTYTSPAWSAVVRTFGAHSITGINLNGWWELIPASVITGATSAGGAGIFTAGPNDGPNLVQEQAFDQTTSANSWVFLVAKTLDNSGNVLNWSIYNRNMKIVVSSPTTNFWFNTTSQILDSETLLPLYDKIRVLRSNLDAYGMPLKQSDIYDVVGFVFDNNGEIIKNQLEVLPTNTENFAQSGNNTPANILQFENFVAGAWQYTVINISNPSNPTIVAPLACGTYTQISGYDSSPYDFDLYEVDVISTSYGDFSFSPGNFMSTLVDPTASYQLARQLFVPAPAVYDPVTNVYGCNVTAGLDFMWQHYTPDSNLIDPSVSNIHDAYVLTNGYYTNVMNWVNGLTTVEPQLPTPLDLVTSYGYLLNSAMLSDTVVFHPGKIKLLFGALADQTLQGTFYVVVAPTATFSNERIQQEIINVINTYFQIQQWNFGDTFYATELIGLIHQALPTQIASVVLVPTYSVNSFGSLFTINSGFDEVLQSAATVSNVQIVAALTPAIMRQH